MHSEPRRGTHARVVRHGGIKDGSTPSSSWVQIDEVLFLGGGVEVLAGRCLFTGLGSLARRWGADRRCLNRHGKHVFSLKKADRFNYSLYVNLLSLKTENEAKYTTKWLSGSTTARQHRYMT